MFLVMSVLRVVSRVKEFGLSAELVCQGEVRAQRAPSRLEYTLHLIGFASNFLPCGDVSLFRPGSR